MIFLELVHFGDRGVIRVFWSYSSKIYMTPSLLGLGDGTNRRAVADLGGVGQVKKQIPPLGEPLCSSDHPPIAHPPPFVFVTPILLCKIKKNAGMELLL